MPVSLPKNRTPPHPGEILSEEFLVPLEISQTDFAKRLAVSLQTLNLIINGKRGVTADMALRLAKQLKTSPEMWMGLQADHDLAKARNEQESRRA